MKFADAWPLLLLLTMVLTLALGWVLSRPSRAGNLVEAFSEAFAEVMAVGLLAGAALLSGLLALISGIYRVIG